MSSSIITTCKSPSRRVDWLIRMIGAFALLATALAQDVNLRAPSQAIAGNSASIASSGSGTATLYLVGPDIALKRDVRLGEDISLSSKELQAAGQYVATVCSSSCSSASFFVGPAKPASLVFLAHPSRAPVGQNDSVSGVALPFDEFHNLVLAPASVDFQLSAKGNGPSSQKVETHNGVAWFRTRSGKSAGTLQIVASLNDVTARRVVQEVASDPCSLRIKGQRTAKGIMVETEPVHDCSGNPVPDGTMITFTARSGSETSTVDAPVKQDVARARILADGPVVISVASGVVMGNELHVGKE